MSAVTRIATAFCLAVSIAPLCAVLAAGQFLEDIQVSKRGEEATITIELACPMRFQSDARTQQGVLLEIRVVPLENCRELGIDSISSEVYRPVGGQLAHLTEVEYESLGLGETLLMFHFDRPVDYRVAQRGDLRSLQLIVRLGGEAAQALEPPAVLPAPAPPASSVPTPPRTPPAARPPLTSRVREPGGLADYVINLQSTRAAVPPAVVEGLAVPADRKPYVSEARVDGETWYRLRVGFFASEQEARAVLQGFVAAFPRAWVGRAEPDEVALASSFAFAAGSTVVAKPPAEQEALAAAAAATRVTGPGTLSSERLQELQQEGRNAILNQDYEAAIRVYTRLLQEPGEHRAEAREYLGLARERNGQVAHASAEYRAYLEEYPDAEGVRRVRQRLNGLALAAQTPRSPLRKSEVATQSRWDVATGVSQYYRRDVNQFDEDLPEIVSLEALLTDLDMNVRRTGGAVDLIGRISISNMYDLMGETRNRPGNRNRISYAYLDASPTEGDWAVRVGRQTLHNWGVLGRFDGVHASYDWAPERRVHFTSGYPVESTRNGVETYRRFYGAAVDFDQLVGSWDFSTFISSQTIEGVSDREAVGFEAHYLDDKRSLTSMVDYDYDYGELNTALVLATWRFDNRLTLTGLVDVRTSPVLTTRNALIGQPVTTIEELLRVLTEDELQQLARDRTADSTTMTLGFAKPLFERFQINADITVTEIGGTIGSFGVPALPGTGRQIYYSTSFVGSGLFGSGDVSIFNFRHGVSDEFTTSQLTWDARFPVGRRVRLNPRLRLGVWENVNGRKRETTSPSFRLLLNTREHYRLEVEIGNDEFLRTELTSRQDSTGNYVNIGYRADF
jgi:hypothetical protein